MLTYSQVIDFALGRPTVVIFIRWKYYHTSCRGNVVNDAFIVSVLSADPVLSLRVCFCNFKVAHIISSQWRTEGGLGVGVQGSIPRPPPPKFRSFDKVEPDFKLSGKCIVFLFQHLN